MAQPEEFVAQGKEQHVCKLKKCFIRLETESVSMVYEI